MPIDASHALSRMAHVRRTAPEVYARTRHVLLPKDFLRLWLTGDHVAEMSDAAGTAWLDTGARDWSDDLLAATGLSRAQMPRLVEGSQVSGALRAILAERWGMPAGVVVAAWGNHGSHLGRDQQVIALLPRLTCLKVTKARQPSHPLYLSRTLKPVPFAPHQQ